MGTIMRSRYPISWRCYRWPFDYLVQTDHLQFQCSTQYAARSCCKSFPVTCKPWVSTAHFVPNPFLGCHRTVVYVCVNPSQSLNGRLTDYRESWAAMMTSFPSAIFCTSTRAMCPVFLFMGDVWWRTFSMTRGWICTDQVCTHRCLHHSLDE